MVSNRLEWYSKRIQHHSICSIRVGFFVGGLCYHFLWRSSGGRIGTSSWEDEIEEAGAGGVVNEILHRG